MKLENLTPEQIEQAKECKTPEECLAFIRENGIELTEEQLEKVSGGALFKDLPCWLGLHDYWATGQERQGLSGIELEFRCQNCGVVNWFGRNDRQWWQ